MALASTIFAINLQVSQTLAAMRLSLGRVLHCMGMT